VAFGEDEQVAFGDRKAVMHGEHGAAFGQDSLPDLRGAEGAIGRIHGLSRNFLDVSLLSDLFDLVRSRVFHRETAQFTGVPPNSLGA
jgi:hypothetical protein